MSYLLRPHAFLTSEIEVKRSRFLTAVKRVDAQEEAREFINERKSAMPDARHHCHAFAVTVKGANPIFHSSDDGEPSGTAGRPMLDVLTGADIVDAVAVVTRYFGGTLLGTGGLVRAYSDAVRTCLEGADLFTRRIMPVWNALLPHADAGRYLAELSAAGYEATPEYLADGVLVSLPSQDDAPVRDLFSRLSSGTIKISPAGEQTCESYAGVIIDGRPSNLM